MCKCYVHVNHRSSEISKNLVKAQINKNKYLYKPPINNYYIYNTDEPYAEVIRGIVMGDETVKANNLSKNLISKRI